jgi:cell wall-associated NlpC family hydrolase
VLHERSSYQMAEFAPTQIKFKDLLPGNLMFFASNGGSTWSDVDHVGIFLGNNWMIHSTDGGPQIEWVGDGYYYDNYVFGRGLKSKDLGPAGVFDLTAGEPAIGP